MTVARQTGSSLATYQDLVDDGKRILYETSDTPRIDAEILIQHTVDEPLSWLIAHGDSAASAAHTKEFYRLIAERQKGQPIAYLIGERDFWSLTLSVNEHVLIPRPDTETLVESALECLATASKDNERINILDLGTGSGAIALSLAKEHSSAKITAVDYSHEALYVARHNAERNNINNAHFIQSNWFDALGSEQRFDLIASNPPYIDDKDPHLEQGDVRFEPNSALVAKSNGLADLQLIIASAPEFLNNDAWLIVEHGYNQGEAVTQLFKQNGFSSISLHQDINGLDRCTKGQLVR